MRPFHYPPRLDDLELYLHPTMGAPYSWQGKSYFATKEWCCIYQHPFPGMAEIEPSPRIIAAENRAAEISPKHWRPMDYISQVLNKFPSRLWSERAGRYTLDAREKVRIGAASASKAILQLASRLPAADISINGYPGDPVFIRYRGGLLIIHGTDPRPDDKFSLTFFSPSLREI